MVFLRNPTGNIYLKDSEVWKGDWSPLSDKWSSRTRKQLNYYVSEAEIKENKKKAKHARKMFKMNQIDPETAKKQEERHQIH